MSALPRPDVTGPARVLNDALHGLHHHAGWPSLRALAKETGVSHTTVSKAFSRPDLPTWGTLELLVEAMDGDTSRFHKLWLTASAPTDGPLPRGPRIAGRRTELDVVRRHLESGTGLLLVTGEAGIGKTTLVSAAVESAATLVATGHCLPLSTALPLLPIADALRSTWAVDDGTWFDQALESCPAYVRDSLARMIPDLQLAGSAPDSSDDFARQRLFMAVDAILAALSIRRPTALVLEDLHWGDATTLDLLAHFTRQPTGVPVLATWRTRDAEVSSDHTEWLLRVRRLGAVSELVLGLLNREETAEQLRLANGRDVNEHVLERVFSKGQGLPLFSAHLTATDADGPQHLADLLDLRLGQLDGHDWAVARALGLAERRVPSSVLRDCTGLAPDELAASLHLLAGRHLLRSGTGDDVELSHPLLVDAIRRRLVPGEAASVHGRLAESLSGRVDPEPGELAWHWQNAGQPQLEIGCRVTAARRARERFARRDELDAWRRVLALWDTGSRADGIELWEVMVAAIDAASDTAAFEVGRSLVERAVGLDLPDEARIHVLRRAGALLCEAGDQERGQHYLDEAVGLIESLPTSPALVDVLQDRVEYAGLTRLADAQAAIRRGLAILDSQEDLRRRRRLLNWAAWYELANGDCESALAVSREARAIRLPDNEPTTEVALAIMATDILVHAGAPHEQVAATARDAFEEVAKWHLESSTVDVILRLNVGMAHLNSGDVAAAEAVIEPVTRADPTPITAQAHVLRAAIDLRLGRVLEALDRSGRAVEAVPNKQDESWLECVGVLADLELWADRPGSAAALTRDAIDTAWPTDVARLAGRTLVLHARAVADVLDATNASAAERLAAVDGLRKVAVSAAVDPLGPRSIGVAVTALAASWRAEVARVEQGRSVRAWVAAATAWDGLHRPHDAAYCRWRAAQGALREGEGTMARRLLKRAAADAHEHVPLSRAIADTMGNGR